MSRITKKQFNKILSRPHEDLNVINKIESILKRSRGYVIRMPKPGSDIIHLVSGGLDSIVTWAILMDVYKLKVHPIMIKTWQNRNIFEAKALVYYSKLFKKLYPNRYIDPFEITYPSSPPEIKDRLSKKLLQNIHPKVLKKSYDHKTNSYILTRKYLYPAFVTFPAARAALFFDMQRNTKIRIISEAILPSDGEFNESQTLTSLRGAMLAMCTFTNDYSWQIFSLCFEKEILSLYSKGDLVVWASKHNIPLEYTYSCLRNYKHNCGNCVNCCVRKKAFKEANVNDKTLYEDQIKNPKKYLGVYITKILKIIKKYMRYKELSINHYTK